MREDSGGVISKQRRTYSDLSGIFMEASLAVDVHIFKEHDQTLWRMELHDDSARPVVWRNGFATPDQAWNAFLFVVRNEGMGSVAGDLKVCCR